MSDVGHPIDAIELIGNLYSNSSTSFQTTSLTTTPTITISHGIIQGDTLNSYLFTIFLKPLLQWLAKDFCSYKLNTSLT